MRKRRLIVILCLSLILCFMCVTTNTFSWFNRTEESGKTLVLNDRKYNKSDKKSLSSDTGTFSSTTYMQKDGEYTEEVKNNSIDALAIESGDRQCFKTEIVSTSENTTDKTAQNVSLYLSGVSSDNNSMTYVGVNNPMRTYKSLSSNQAIISDTFSLNSRVFYVGFNKAQNYEPSQYKLRYYYDENNYGDVVLSDKATGTGNDKGSVLEDFGEIKITQLNYTYRTFAVVIPYSYTGAQLWHDGDKDYFYEKKNNDIDTNNYMGLWKNGKDYITTNVNVGQSASIKCPSKITINKGGSCDLSSYFKGNKVEYKSEKEDIAKVTDNKLNGIREGSTIIDVTCTGVLGETMTAKFNVEVQDVVEKFENVPVVTNMEVVPSTKDKQNVLTVYWYIKNTSSKSIKVSVDKINVTL